MSHVPTYVISDENVALSETIPLPQQYTVHVHATPEHSSPTPKVNSTLPGLYKSRKPYKPEKTNQIQNTTLPDITAMPSSQGKNTAKYTDGKRSQLQNMLPKLHYSDESDTGRKKATTRSNEPIGCKYVESLMLISLVQNS